MDIDATLDQIEALLLTIPERISVDVRGSSGSNRFITMHDCPGTEYGWVHGSGATARDAYGECLHKRAAAALNTEKLRTASEMRDAVLKIVPADCREAIEALPVAA